MSAAESGGIFISYRREDTSHLAGRLYDRLADRFGDAQVFMDVDSIEPGVDFAEVITRAVGVCDVLLAVIGRHWLTAATNEGGRRLDDPDDVVRLEVKTALERNIRVIPVLVEGAAMPRAQDLPDNLAKLVRRNALTVRHETFRSDADHLVATIERVLASRTAAPAEAAPPLEVLSTPKRPTRAAPTPGTLRPVGPRDLVSGLTVVLQHSGVVRAAAFSPDGHLLATIGGDAVRIWDVSTGQVRLQIPAGSGVGSVAFSPDGHLAATSLLHRKIRVWDTVSGEQLMTLPAGLRIRSARFSPDGRLLATTSRRQVRVWDTATGQERVEFTHEGLRSVAFSPDGRLLAVTGGGAAVRVWDAATGQERIQVPAGSWVTKVAFSTDGRLLVTTSPAKVRIWDAATGQERIRMPAGAWASSATFSPDGRLLATVRLWHPKVRIWEVATGQERIQVPVGLWTRSATFSPDGGLLATTRLWHRKTWIWALSTRTAEEQSS